MKLRQMVFVAVVNFTNEDNTLVRQCGNDAAEVEGLIEIQRGCCIDRNRCRLRPGVVLQSLTRRRCGCGVRATGCDRENDQRQQQLAGTFHLVCGAIHRSNHTTRHTPGTVVHSRKKK